MAARAKNSAAADFGAESCLNITDGGRDVFSVALQQAPFATVDGNVYGVSFSASASTGLAATWRFCQQCGED